MVISPMLSPVRSAIPWDSTVQGVLPNRDSINMASPVPKHHSPTKSTMTVVGRKDHRPVVLHEHSETVRLAAGRATVSSSQEPAWVTQPYSRCMADVTILHNTSCSTSRFALGEAERLGSDHEIVEYLKHPLDRDQLLELMEKLEDPPADLVRKDGYFEEQGLDVDDYTTPEAVADLLVEHPRLMQRPVLVRGNRAIIGRPKDRVDAFLQS